MSLLTNRKGDWIQLFLVAFFFLLIFIALALLFMEKNSLVVVRPQVTDDLHYLEGQAVITSLLRQPIQGVDINGDDEPDAATIADAIVVNDGKYDELIKKEILTRFTGALFSIDIGYPDRNLTIDNIPSGWKDIQWWAGSGWVRAPVLTPSMLMEDVPRVERTLPGSAANIHVTFVYADTGILLDVLDIRDSKGLAIIDRMQRSAAQKSRAES